MRGGFPANRFNREFNKRRDVQKGGIVIIVAWILIATWIGFLIYCWQSGAIDQKRLKELKENVESVISRTEQTFLRQSPWSSTIKSESTTAPIAVPSEQQNAIDIAIYNEEHKDDVLIIFSTDCTPYQDWQTLLLFHSAKAVHQKGTVTRIASGCSPEKQHQLSTLYSQLYGSMYNAHFTPDFKRDEKTNRSCK
jgi:hypothetical protein